MTERKPSQGTGRRNDRLRAALRENLKRRKAQARGRAGLQTQPERSSAPGPKTSDSESR